VRLFVAIWPPPPVVAALSELDCPDVGTVRWTAPSRWHITLAFLGNAAGDGTAPEDPAAGDDATRDEAVARLGRIPVGTHAGTVARLGTVIESFGRSVLYVPALGLDALAQSVRTTYFSAVATATDSAAFNGHLTVGRARRRRDDVRPLAGLPVGPAGGMEWPVDELALVASVSEGGKGRYQTVATRSVPDDDYPTSNMRSGLQ
jgi:2'-5' RNA ligase